MSVSLLTNAIHQPAAYALRLGSWLIPGRQQQISHWTLEQMNIQPYQHLLQIGFGKGITLEQAARRLGVGFIAAIDESPAMYRQASRRNRHFIQQDLMQLHIGRLHELSYPSQYFHTIYGINAHLHWKDPQQEFLRLAGMLKNGGRMIMTFQVQHSSDAIARAAVEKIEEDYSASGLTDIRIRYMEMTSSACISASAGKA